MCYFIGTENQFEPIDNGEYYTGYPLALIYTIENGMLVYKTNINSSTYAGMTKDNSISYMRLRKTERDAETGKTVDIFIFCYYLLF